VIYAHTCTIRLKKMITETGFEIQTYKDIISVKVTKLFDIFLLTAWPSQLFKPFLGKRWVWRPKIMEDILTGIFINTLDEEESYGTNLLIIAQKPKNKK